jgi:hypothetical protein
VVPAPAQQPPPLHSFSGRRDLFAKTGVKPSQIGVLIVNCSLFVPTPSWCAHIMNHFKMGSNVLSFNLGGMGCSGEPLRHSRYLLLPSLLLRLLLLLPFNLGGMGCSCKVGCSCAAGCGGGGA